MWSSIIERLGILEADVKGCVSLVQSHGGPFRLRVIVWVPIQQSAVARVGVNPTNHV